MAPAVVMANVLGAAAPPLMRWTSGCITCSPVRDAHVHLYGKEERPDAKSGM